jgi:hypothetical protein
MAWDGARPGRHRLRSREGTSEQQAERRRGGYDERQGARRGSRGAQKTRRADRASSANTQGRWRRQTKQKDGLGELQRDGRRAGLKPGRSEQRGARPWAPAGRAPGSLLAAGAEQREGEAGSSASCARLGEEAEELEFLGEARRASRAEGARQLSTRGPREELDRESSKQDRTPRTSRARREPARQQWSKGDRRALEESRWAQWRRRLRALKRTGGGGLKNIREGRNDRIRRSAGRKSSTGAAGDRADWDFYF